MRKKIHRHIYFAGLCIIAFFLPLSEYITNAALFLILTNWIIEADFKSKLHKLKSSKGIAVFLLLFLVHIIWLFNTENLDFALNDIRIKLPLLAYPIIIGTSKSLLDKQINIISIVFISGVLISTLAGLVSYFGFTNYTEIENVRELSIFVSHIRLSLMICLSILLILYFLNEKVIKNKYAILGAILISVWFLVFLGMIQGFTGLGSLILVGLASLFIKVYKEKRRRLKISLLVIAFIIPFSLIFWLGIQIKNFYTPENPRTETPVYTNLGNYYYHNQESRLIENGNLIYVDINEKELYASWNRRSAISLDGFDGRGQEIKHTLIRYLTSKGLRKDAAGVNSLSDGDIYHIENGKTNYKYVKNTGIKQRIYNIIWQLDVYVKGGNPSGHSITQRIEYLKYGTILVYRNFMLGTGTGDIDDEYKELYIERRSAMDPQYRHRAHNQYLTFFVSFGSIGAILCLIAWFFPIISDYKRYYPFAVFFLIASLSMLTDDTLETTTGVVFISYFYSLYLWGRDKNDIVEIEQNKSNE